MRGGKFEAEKQKNYGLNYQKCFGTSYHRGGVTWEVTGIEDMARKDWKCPATSQQEAHQEEKDNCTKK